MKVLKLRFPLDKMMQPKLFLLTVSTLKTKQTHNLFIKTVFPTEAQVHRTPLIKSAATLCGLPANARLEEQKGRKRKIFGLFFWRSQGEEQNWSRQMKTGGKRSESLSLSPLTAVSI